MQDNPLAAIVFLTLCATRRGGAGRRRGACRSLRRGRGSPAAPDEGPTPRPTSACPPPGARQPPDAVVRSAGRIGGADRDRAVGREAALDVEPEPFVQPPRGGVRRVHPEGDPVSTGIEAGHGRRARERGAEPGAARPAAPRARAGATRGPRPRGRPSAGSADHPAQALSRRARPNQAASSWPAGSAREPGLATPRHRRIASSVPDRVQHRRSAHRAAAWRDGRGEPVPGRRRLDAEGRAERGGSRRPPSSGGPRARGAPHACGSRTQPGQGGPPHRARRRLERPAAARAGAVHRGRGAAATLLRARAGRTRPRPRPPRAASTARRQRPVRPPAQGGPPSRLLGGSASGSPEHAPASLGGSAGTCLGLRARRPPRPPCAAAALMGAGAPVSGS